MGRIGRLWLAGLIGLGLAVLVAVVALSDAGTDRREPSSAALLAGADAADLGSRVDSPTEHAPRVEDTSEVALPNPRWLRNGSGPAFADGDVAGERPVEHDAESPEAAPRAEPSVAESTVAPTPPSARGPETIAERGEAALARISYPWRSLGFEIHFAPPRDGLRGVTYNSRREIHVYVRLSDPVARTAHDLAHEIGHAVDLVHMDGERRREWLRARGAEGADWWSCDYCEDRTHGSGDFAEVFALRQIGPTYFSSRLAAAPSSRELERLSTFFRPGDDWRRYYGSPRDDAAEDEEDDEGGVVICVVNCR